MTDKFKIPEEIVEEAERHARREMVRQVSNTLEKRAASILPKQEQADILRRMADQLDKADERTGVLASTKDRLDAKYQPTSFFTGQDRHRAYWEGRAERPDYKAAKAAVDAKQQHRKETFAKWRSQKRIQRTEYWQEQLRAKVAAIPPIKWPGQQDQEPRAVSWNDLIKDQDQEPKM